MRLPATRIEPSCFCFTDATAAATSLPTTVVLFHSGSLSVEETTYFGIAFIFFAKSPSSSEPSRSGQAPAKLS